MPIHPDTLPLPAAVAFLARISNPEAGIFNPETGVFNPEIVLLRVKDDKVQIKYWNSEGWSTGWSGWMNITPPAGTIRDTGSYFPVLGWFDVNSRYRWNGFFSLQANPSSDDPIGQKIGTPWEDFLSQHWDELTPPNTPVPVPLVRGFEPRSGFSYLTGRITRLNVFGVAQGMQSPKAISLRELLWNGSNWLFHDHGLPSGADRVSIGAQSALWPNGNNNHFAFVFVTSHEADPAGHSRLWARYWHAVNYPNWRWIDLGYPGNVHSLREPLTVSYKDPRTGKPHINVFVVGTDPTANKWRLYNRHWYDGNWGDWEVWGSPPGSGAGTGSGFHLTSGVVWYEGSTLRINLFGYTDVAAPGGPTGYSNRPGVLGHLINFWWNGANWAWGETVPAPSNRPLRTISSVFYSGNGRKRLSVFSRDNYGAVYERFWDTGVALEWRWVGTFLKVLL